jgi:hypothetical protein
LVSGFRFNSSTGRSLITSQSFVPESIEISLVSRPPWLWPITTIRPSAGSAWTPPRDLTAGSSEWRSTSAETGIGLPVLYVKNQNS